MLMHARTADGEKGVTRNYEEERESQSTDHKNGFERIDYELIPNIEFNDVKCKVDNENRRLYLTCFLGSICGKPQTNKP